VDESKGQRNVGLTIACGMDGEALLAVATLMPAPAWLNVTLATQ